MLKIGKKAKNIPPPFEKGMKLCSVVFDDTFMGIVSEDGKDYFVVATYDGHGNWIVRTKSLIRAEVQWKLARIANDVYDNFMEKSQG